jgi:hypothetical protein
MPFDTAGFPKDDAPAEPAPGPLWLRCFIATMIFAMLLMAMGAGWRIAHYIEHL